MVDIPSIAAAMTSLKTAADIAKGMLDLKAGADARGVVIDLQSVILNAQSSALAAQSEQMTLLQRVAELEKEASRAAAWESEKQRYRLRDYGNQRFAYELRLESANGEPLHRLCAKCFQEGRKSILHFQSAFTDSSSTRTERYDCAECKTEFWF
jgi:hypothetical protein